MVLAVNQETNDVNPWKTGAVAHISNGADILVHSVAGDIIKASLI